MLFKIAQIAAARAFAKGPLGRAATDIALAATQATYATKMGAKAAKVSTRLGASTATSIVVGAKTAKYSLVGASIVANAGKRVGSLLASAPKQSKRYNDFGRRTASNGATREGGKPKHASLSTRKTKGKIAHIKADGTMTSGTADQIASWMRGRR
jgi:hypothetical protein